MYDHRKEKKKGKKNLLQYQIILKYNNISCKPVRSIAGLLLINFPPRFTRKIKTTVVHKSTFLKVLVRFLSPEG